MILDLVQAVPEQWRGFFHVFVLPIRWLFPLQSYLLHGSWYADLWGVALLKRIFLFIPVVSVIVGLWCSMLAIYTLLFRSGRLKFIGMLLVLWWDVARSTWLFWAGMGQFLFVAFGSLWGLLRLMVGVLLEIIREIFELPFVLTGRFTRNLRSPGVPWIAFLMTVLWSALEAAVFSYILTPTFSEILSDLVGTDVHRYLTPCLFVMLFFLIAGSFACLYVLVEAIREKNVTAIVQMAIVEVFVMFVEVVFLYRELIDALTPWIAQQTGLQMGIVPVILFACFGWVGVRAMVWFLFARFGTPTLLALIARQRLADEEPERASAAKSEERLEQIFHKLKSEQSWFQQQAHALLEAAVLPIFQVIATLLNFAFVFFLSRALFNIPFHSLAEVGETKTLLQNLIAPKEAR
jgi:hypothetical protein